MSDTRPTQSSSGSQKAAVAVNPNPNEQADGGVHVGDAGSIQNYDGDIAAIVNDDTFITNLRNNFMDKVSDKRGFFRELFSCMFVKPVGVRKLDHASRINISNREYQAFAADTAEFLKSKYPDRFKKMQAQSPLYKRYQSIWPECSDQITQDILALGSKIEQQKKIQEMLGRNPAPASGQPK